MTGNQLHQRAAVTICSLNYVPKAKVLLETYSEFHQTDDLFLLIVDRRPESFPIEEIPAKVIWADELGIEAFDRKAFCFDVIELNTNVKPFVLRKLLSLYDQVLYLDPDICIYAPLSPVFDALQNASVVVTPHTNTPVLDGHVPDDLGFLRFGAYNLGFVGVSRCAEAEAFLDWWGARCMALGFYEPQAGLAVDQKWVDLAPAFFPNLKILHDPGLNVAFWNLHERRISKGAAGYLVNEIHVLHFIHFSSFSENTPEVIANKQTRFLPGSRPDLLPLAEIYAARLRAATSSGASWPTTYGFDFFDDGVPITPTLRRVYATLPQMFPEANPFSPQSAVRQYAARRRLLNKDGLPSKRLTFKDAGKFERHERWIFTLLRLALRVLGPDRYFALMRYMAHISSIRNQAGVFKE
jgi:hypothetical protein